MNLVIFDLLTIHVSILIVVYTVLRKTTVSWTITFGFLLIKSSVGGEEEAKKTKEKDDEVVGGRRKKQEDEAAFDLTFICMSVKPIQSDVSCSYSSQRLKTVPVSKKRSIWISDVI